MKRKIKLFDPVIGKEEEDYLRNVLKSGFWASGSGTGYVMEFEKKFQQYCGAKECIAVNSGTAALHLALSTIDIQNKEVILPSLTFISTAHAVLYNKGIPVFAEVDPQTLCIDPTSVKEKITKKSKLILPVHFGGMPCDLTKLINLAHDYNLELTEDAAHACGANFNGRKIGSYSPLVCFSFHPVKNLAMPTGGLIAVNRRDHSRVKRILAARRWTGITDRKGASYDVKEIGWNYYMNEFAAAVGLAQLQKLDRLNDHRKRIAKRYHEEISVEHKMSYSDNCSYHFYWIIVKNRESFRKKMEVVGIETGIHYRPIHTMTMYKYKTSLPVTEKIGNQIVTLPTHPNLSENDIDRIIKSVNAFS